MIPTVDTSSYNSSANAPVNTILESLPMESEVIMIGNSTADNESMNAIPHKVHATADDKTTTSETVPVFEPEANNVSSTSGDTVLSESPEKTPCITSHDTSSTQGNTKALPKITENIFISNGVSTPKRRILQDWNVDKMSDHNATASTENIGASKVVSPPMCRISQVVDMSSVTDSATGRPKLTFLSTDTSRISQAPVSASVSTAIETTSVTCNDTSSGVFAPPMAKRKLIKSPIRWSAGPTNDNTIVACAKGADKATHLSDVRNVDDPIGQFFSKYKWYVIGGISFVIVFTIILIVMIATVVSLSSTYYVVSQNQLSSNTQVNIDTPQQFSQVNPMYTPQQQDIIMQEFQNILSNPSYSLMDYGTPVEEQIFRKQHLPKLANLLRQTIVKIIYSPVWFIGNSVKAAWSGINRLLNLKPKHV